MSDLVKRLRFPLSQLDGGPNDEKLWDRIYTDRDEAADRIETLEAALRSIAANTCCDKCQEAALVARAALAEEKK